MRGMNSERRRPDLSRPAVQLQPATTAPPLALRRPGPRSRTTWTLDDIDLAWHGEIVEQNPAVYEVINAAGVAHSSGMKFYFTRSELEARTGIAEHNLQLSEAKDIHLNS